MQQIFFLEPEPGAGHSWTGSTTLVPLASFYFYLNHILNISVCGLPVVELVTEVAGVGGPPLNMMLEHVVLHDGV